MTAEGGLDDAGQVLVDLGFSREDRLGAAVWKGSLGDRACTLTISRQGRTRYAGEVRYRQHLGFRLRIDVDTQVPTRLFFVRTGFASHGLARFIYRLRRQRVIERLPASIDDHQVVTRDTAWAKSLLAEDAAMADVGALVGDKAVKKLYGSVYLQPGKLHYASPILQREDFTGEWIGSVLERLERIAAAADRLPPPRIAVKIGRFEAMSQRRPVLAALVLLGSILGVLMLFGISAAVLGWLAFGRAA